MTDEEKLEIQALLKEKGRESYEEGYEAGHLKGCEESDDDSYDRGFDDGLHNWEEEALPWTDEFRDELTRKGLEPLESIEVKWDAALRALVCTQKGREVSFR